jgi:putative hydrolase of the HAD superfamily
VEGKSVRYQAISFDAGFTLVEPVQDSSDIVRAIVSGAGFVVGDAALDVGLRAAQQFFFASYELHGNTDWISDDRILGVWDRYYGIIFEALELPIAAHQGLTAQIIQHYNSPSNWRPYPEVRRVLATLRTRGYPLGVVSDWDSGLPAILDHLGLLGDLDFVLASGATGLAKPQAAFYRLALQHADVPAEHMIHIGDSFFADVSGARAAGMHGVLLDRDGRNPPVDCPIVRDLWEFVALLEEHQQG